MASAATAPVPSGSRSRPQARKKLNDDAAYTAPPSAGTKRQATDKADGEPRVKRKRVDPMTVTASSNGKKDAEEPQRSSMVEFSKMPLSVLYCYMTQYDIVPDVRPSPLAAEDPPSPISLANPHRHSSRALSPPAQTTPANRPRRESKEQSRRRSSRLLEEESRSRTPILADADEIQSVLAGIVEKHFRDMPPISGRDEVDTLASFMCAVEKSKGLRIKC
ncbi:hypothetical protein P691DRAFT_770026 [Macrolepiota fuliginosa MF-IS2]|uniref:Histone deacetylase complex subunit SAP30 Sin3 binding domain-containing protein n=1 Tax=Macrolepiota fuliginosa MF-IS2 TaxID=1400762 RepID=A0A9P5XQ56_9AGAR|nr:hypothetical protein P691DRAFT_770026 [Macrolepiota fuliginosa MF-IS2]